jgi:type IV pilus biogenesis/stability protein PilW
MDKKSDKYPTLCVYLTLALTTLVVYWQVRHHDFIDFDDNLYVYRNSHVKAGLKLEELVWAFTEAHAYNWHPLTWISHMLDCEIYGLHPAGHHFSNALFHTANALLLLLLLNRMTRSFWSSAFVAALFALHPLHVESVAWLSERKDVLSTFFWMLTMLAYVYYVEHPSVRRYLVMLVFFALGLMAKQMLVTLPFVLLLLDYWPLGRLRLKQQTPPNSPPTVLPVSARRCILEKLPLLVLSALAAAIVYLIQQQTGLVKSVTHYRLLYRVTNAVVAYVTYIGKMLWPTNLAIFYPHLGGTLPAWQITGALLLLVCITVVAILNLRRRPYLAVGWLWYLGTLVPVIGLVQVGLQGFADRYTYIPLIGLFIAITWAIPDLFARFHLRKYLLSICAPVLLLLLAVMTWSQLGYWRNSIALYEHAATVVPNNRWAYHRLGLTLLGQGNLDQAVSNFTKALQIKPDYIEARCHLARAFADQGKLDKAVEHYTKALQFMPDFATAHSGLAKVLIEQRKPEEAAVHYRQALRTQPNNPGIHNRLGMALAMQGKLDEAIICFNKALQLRPDHSQTHTNLGAALAEQGKLDQAIVHFAKVLRIDPHSLKALKNLGILYFNQGKYQEAADSFRKALRIEPNDPQALHYLKMTIKQRDEPRQPRDENKKP